MQIIANNFLTLANDCIFLLKRITMTKGTITIRIDEELLEFLRKQAKKDVRSVNNYIELVLTNHMNDTKKKPTN